MGKSIKTAALIIVTALIAGGASYWLSRSSETNVRVTIESIRKISELATVEYRLATILDKNYYSSLGLFKVKSDRLIAIYTGAVRGRINLENASIEIQNKADGDYVSIHFKRGSVQISGVEIDPEKDHFDIVSCSEIRKLSLTKGASDNQRRALEKVALQKIKESAIKSGIVDKTIQNAKTILSDFIETFGYRASITFDENAYDPSAA